MYKNTDIIMLLPHPVCRIISNKLPNDLSALYQYLSQPIGWQKKAALRPLTDVIMRYILYRWSWCMYICIVYLIIDQCSYHVRSCMPMHSSTCNGYCGALKIRGLWTGNCTWIYDHNHASLHTACLWLNLGAFDTI